VTGEQQDHIVKSFDEQLNHISETITRMGGLAESQLGSAIDALRNRDSDVASRVVNADTGLDGLEQDVEQSAVRVLALRQPVASDLREIVTAFKIASDTERIGDYSVNVAKRALALNQMEAPRTTTALPRMGRMAQAIVKETFDAYVERDAAKALDVWKRDEEVDEMHTSLFREMLTYMMEDPRFITPGIHLLFCAKNIERIGDLATNVAEQVHYLVTGETIEGKRPKGDTTPYAVTPGPESGDQGDGQ